MKSKEEIQERFKCLEEEGRLLSRIGFERKLVDESLILLRWVLED